MDQRHGPCGPRAAASWETVPGRSILIYRVGPGLYLPISTGSRVVEKISSLITEFPPGHLGKRRYPLGKVAIIPAVILALPGLVELIYTENLRTRMDGFFSGGLLSRVVRYSGFEGGKKKKIMARGRVFGGGRKASIRVYRPSILQLPAHPPLSRQKILTHSAHWVKPPPSARVSIMHAEQASYR